jgi:hypothetical protein
MSAYALRPKAGRAGFQPGAGDSGLPLFNGPRSSHFATPPSPPSRGSVDCRRREPLEVSRRAGRTSSSFTLDRYVHFFTGAVATVADKLEELRNAQ